jgi:hypothetical protein
MNTHVTHHRPGSLSYKLIARGKGSLEQQGPSAKRISGPGCWEEQENTLPAAWRKEIKVGWVTAAGR